MTPGNRGEKPVLPSRFLDTFGKPVLASPIDRRVAQGESATLTR